MVKIVIENLGQKELMAEGIGKTALHHFREHYQDWMQACGGKGKCTSCRFVVVEGAENLGPITLAEEKYQRSGALKSTERLSCQAIVVGSVRVRVPADCQLPHLQYHD